MYYMPLDKWCFLVFLTLELYSIDKYYEIFFQCKSTIDTSTLAAEKLAF